MFAPDAAARRERVAVSVFDPALEQRLVAELAYLGFEPILLPPDVQPSETSLERRVQLEHASAAISEVRGGDHLEIVVLESGRASIGPIEVPSRGPDARDLAIRTAELVRVSLERTRSPQAEPPSSGGDAPPPREPTRFGATLGPAVAGSPGGLGASFHLRASLRYTPHRTYGLVLSGVVPLHPELVSGQEGTADLWLGWVTLGARFAFRPDDALVRPEVGLGVGVFVLTATGHPSATYRANDSRLVTGLAELSGGLEFSITRRVRLRTMAALATCFTRPEVRFAGSLRAHTCLPMGMGELAMTIVW